MAETQDEQNLRCRGSNSTTHRSASLFWLCAVGAASGFVTHGAVLTRAATFANNSRTSQAVAQRSVPRVQVVGSDLDLMDTARADQVLGTTFRFEHRATRADTHLFGVCQPAAIRSDGVDGRYRPTAATGLAPVNGCSAVIAVIDFREPCLGSPPTAAFARRRRGFPKTVGRIRRHRATSVFPMSGTTEATQDSHWPAVTDR